jgi:hypothetical protein
LGFEALIEFIRSDTLSICEKMAHFLSTNRANRPNHKECSASPQNEKPIERAKSGMALAAGRIPPGQVVQLEWQCKSPHSQPFSPGNGSGSIKTLKEPGSIRIVIIAENDRSTLYR